MKINRVGRLPPLIAIFQGLLSPKETLNWLGQEAIFGQERTLIKLPCAAKLALAKVNPHPE